jgi:hypothetical protein
LLVAPEDTDFSVSGLPLPQFTKIMPIPKKNEEKEEEEDELAAFLGRMVSDADREESAAGGGGGGGSSSNFEFGYVYRPGPYQMAETTTMEEEDEDANVEQTGTTEKDDSPKSDTVVSYEDIFKSDSPDGGSLFEAPAQSTFSFDYNKKSNDGDDAEQTEDQDGNDEGETDEGKTEEVVPVQQHPEVVKIVPDAKAKAIVVESQKSEGTLEWMEKFKKIGMKSEEQVTSIDEDGAIIQHGPPPQPFQYSFKAEKPEIDKEEEELLSPQPEDGDATDYFIPLAGGGRVDRETGNAATEMVEESVTEEEIIEDSLHSGMEPVASELLAALACGEDPPGQGEVEVMEFEEEEEEVQVEEEVDEEEEETDTSVESGPIPEEIHKGERGDDLTSAYDPEAEYDASESSGDDEEEDTEEDDDDDKDNDDQGEEIVEEEEIIEETIESDSRAMEDEFLVANVAAAAVEEGGGEGEDETAPDIESQSQHIFSALDKDSQVGDMEEPRAFSDVSKRDDSKSWTFSILMLALFLLAGVIAALIILALQDRGDLRSSVVPIETPVPSQQPTITPVPTGPPSISPSAFPTTTPMPTVVRTTSPTDVPSQTLSPTRPPTTAMATPSSTTSPQTNNPTLSPTAIAQPGENDTCETAIGPLVSNGSFNFGTISGAASVENIEPCGDIVNSGPGVWYYVLGTGGEMLAHTCQDTSFDSKITIFEACDNLNCVEANDNFCGASGTQSAVSWFSNYQQEYRILLSGDPDFVDGSFNLVIEARLNDECSTAIGPLSIEGSIPIMGNTLEATPNSITCDGVTNESPSVWYLVVGTGGQMTADICARTDFPARIRILTGSCDALECLVVSGIIDCSVTWGSVEFQSYYILISGVSAEDVGSFSMTLTLG